MVLTCRNLHFVCISLCDILILTLLCHTYIFLHFVCIMLCEIFILTLLCHTYIFLNFICIILCEIFILTLLCYTYIFCTLFVSSSVRFFFNNCCVAARFCLYRPLWDFYSNTVVSYLHFYFHTGLAFCHLHLSW